MSSGNLFIVDTEFTQKLNATYKTFGNGIESAVKEYLAKLREANDNAIVSGETASALNMYIGYAERLEGKAKTITEDLTTLTSGYIAAIDQADDFLF